ncbi:hypothetical protein PT285_05170 [Lactobacillus sp. ESL0791]|uniref:hypothetical protein n=1 Tax=Lactobacillus sp. ESL0791 TaxID=2983234 RepID=UPI0023F63474|nr:hypothetical protein [Lactobacillus sp. ESL0791]MDF7638786.1 hypothetical protein [Lactobacillus sp. ESL0791]
MAIKIIMGIFIFLLLLTSYYMWHHRNDHFLIYNIQTTHNFSIILIWTATALFLEAVMGFFLLFLFNKYVNLITLFVSVVTILIFTLIINQNNK